MVRWRVRFLAIVCLISLLLSVAIISKTRAEASNGLCVSSNVLPTVVETPIIPTGNQPSVVLNEILPSPQSGWNCAYQNTPGAVQNVWIELYNLLNQPLDLYGARTCIDSGPNTSQYCVTMGSVIPAHDFFTFFPYQSTNYSLPPSDFSTLRLLLNYVPVDQVSVPPLPGDVSYARIPDGTGKWMQDTVPTINSSNTLTISPSPTPTHLNKKHSSKATSQGKKKQTKSTKVKNNNTKSRTVTSITTADDNQTQIDIGKQTRWHSLQFPSLSASPSAFNTTENLSSTPSAPPAPTENISQNILFSLIGFAGLLSIWLGWRRFFKKRQ